MRNSVIVATWDDEAKVWVAESDDIPGLATEAATQDELLSKLRVMIPELLAANAPATPRGEYVVRWEQETRLKMSA